MEGLPYTIIRAVHPHWIGELKLSNIGASVRHGTHRGIYHLSEGRLTVMWDEYGSDIFRQYGDVYIHEELVAAAPDLERTALVAVGNRPFLAQRVSLLLPGSPYKVTLRLGTSDIATFKQIFVDNEYDSRSLPLEAATIVDLGANIGLATIFFGMRYPKARILSVEPETNNYELMIDNTSALGARVRTSRAAVWNRDGFINLHSAGQDGSYLGAWGVQVSEMTGRSSVETKCLTLKTLLNEAGLKTVDILKIDIEGAELELFSERAEEWLSRVRLIIIETHDRFRPGSDAAVRNALRSAFRELDPCGENLLFENVATAVAL